jgi:hypothetical protein
MLTHNTANSAYVHQEIGCALAREKLVIPLVQPGIGEDQLAMLDGVEYIEFDFDSPTPAWKASPQRSSGLPRSSASTQMSKR